MRKSNKQAKSSKKPVQSPKATKPTKVAKPKPTEPTKKPAPAPTGAAGKATKAPVAAANDAPPAPVAPPAAKETNATGRTPSSVAQTRVLDEPNAKKAISALQKFGSTELQRIFAALFGAETTSRNVMFLRSAISKGLLDRADGNRPVPPSEETRAARKAPTPAPAAPKAPKARDPRVPPPGTTIERSYKGETIRVKVLEEGFSYKGTTYSSLSALAKTLTQCSTNGLLWFGLTERPAKSSTSATASANTTAAEA